MELDPDDEPTLVAGHPLTIATPRPPTIRDVEEALGFQPPVWRPRPHHHVVFLLGWVAMATMLFALASLLA
ncbi:MAG: hypothetical protein EP330_21930 [Deltaproteobacteria bacterium]|nr:MAG: hypothetical protein EP330_21930 [Deltaproteobacteria bacterium]